MKARDIIQYENGNENTILLVVNKTVCRAFEVSAFWLSKSVPTKKLYSKYSVSMNNHMIYAWFSVRKLDKVLDTLRQQGFRPISSKKGCIILQKEGIEPEGFNEWRESVCNNVMLEQQAHEPKQ